MRSKLLPFLALTLTALCLVPAGAHLFELPNKLGLGRDAYFTVQGIYSGWSLFGLALLGAILADACLALAVRRRQPRVWAWASAAALLLVLSLAIFFAFVFPGNQATANWTVAPDDWEVWRRRWEYGHAAGALANAAAFCAVAKAALEWRA